MNRPVMHWPIVITLVALIFIAKGLAGCTTPGQPRIEVREVKVPVVRPCPDGRDPAPVYPDTLAAIQAAIGTDALVALLLAGRDLRITREGENEAQIVTCSRPPPDS